MKYTQELYLDVSNDSGFYCVRAKQGDRRTRYIKVTIIAGSEKMELDAATMSADLRCVKPDSTSVIDPGTINPDGTVTVELTEQVLAVAGLVRADIAINAPDGGVLSTVSFVIQVEKAPLGKNIPSTNEFLTLYELIQKVQALIDNEGTVGTIALDKTLSIENMAADAKAVGDLVAQVENKIPTKTSDLTNNSGFITKAVADLLNYYGKAETYNRNEINALVSAIPKFAIKVVSGLPTEDISETAIYLVPGGDDSDLYTEYIFVDGAWEVLGSQRVDLTGYAKEDWVVDKLGNYALAAAIPSWAKQTTKPSYTATEVGADSSGTAEAKVKNHDESDTSHQDIRKLISQLSSEIDDLKSVVVGGYTKAEIDAIIADLKAQGVQQVPALAQGTTLDECLAWLSENGDPSKVYIMPKGISDEVYGYIETTITGPAYTNILDTAEVTINKRWSHSGKKLSDAAGHVAIGYFPAKVDDVVRVSSPGNLKLNEDYNRYHYFDADKNYAAGHTDGAIDIITALTAESEGVTSWVVGYECTTNNNDSSSVKISGADSIAYMNLILKLSSTTITEDDIAGLVVTVNEPIEITTVTGKQWASTGHKFLPADYEERIIAAEKTIAEHDTQIAALEKAVETGGVDDSETAALNRIKNWKYPIHEDAPVFLLESDKPAIASDEQTTEAVYAKYDALMVANPDFITRVDCGMASDGTTPIYVYHFREAEPHYASSVWSETKPVLLICSGVHPTEQTGVHSLYHAMEEITTNLKLRDLRRNVHFIVMPMINPTGFTDSTYGVRNPDGIQVHYNFEVDFKYPTDAGYVENGNRNHGGETPLSIPETQYFDALMQEYQDTLACVISCHNNDVDVNRGTGYIWCSCATHAMCNLGFRFVDKMSAAWREKYGDAFDEGVRWANEYALAAAAAGTSSLFDPSWVYEQPEWDHRVGMASLSGSGGTEYKQALKYGVHGINVETCDRCMILDKDFGKKRTANVVTMGTETYINFFRTFMAFYNPLLKQEYAPNLPWA